MKNIVFFIIAPLLFLSSVHGEEHFHEMTDEQMSARPEMAGMMNGILGRYSMRRESSGTSWQPDSSPHEGIQAMKGVWHIMTHGYVTTVYDRQRGPRGDKEVFSSSMLMTMAQRPWAKGRLGLRGMFSLDPLMGKSGYPLLLQTGETADGKTELIDRQHPHDFLMEAAAVYSRVLAGDTSVFIYLGLPGEPALGSPAFMHRFSSLDNPMAPIMHHWLDSTHITYGVGTMGYIWREIKVEGSVFTGREPDQKRWNIESPKFDSYSGRLSFNPAKNWALQISYGDIHSPEQLEPDVDTKRATASVSYNQPIKQGNWQSTFAWGNNDNSAGNNLAGFLLESALRFNSHTVFSRVERVDKDELFPEGDPLYGKVFRVNKINMGYIHDWSLWNQLNFGVGASFDVNIVPAELKSVYGDNPAGYTIFARIKLLS